MSTGDRLAPGDGQQTGVSISATDSGITVRDAIERRQYALSTSSPVTPQTVAPERFLFPVDTAVEVATSAIELPNVIVVFVRDATGRMLGEAEQFAHESFPDGEYSLELCAPVKIYLRVDGAMTVLSDAERTRIEFDQERTVIVGARSRHERPAATVRTSSAPEDVMAAVSTFGSALKTTSPERSFPTLRGHPPTIELADDLGIPPGLEPPETGVRIEVPPRFDRIFPVVPLAYYLGAEVVPAAEPRIVAGDAVDYRLDGPEGFETTVERVLKRVFTLDCLTRTEGFYQVDLHERRAVEPTVDLDFPDLYDRSLAEQLSAYLQVPYEAVADHVPEWKLTTHVTPTAGSVESLPFLVDELAVVHTDPGEPVDRATVPTPIAEATLGGGEFTRGDAGSGTFVRPPGTESLEQAWVGDGTPIGASKSTAEAYRNRLERSPAAGDVSITVVCNDERMAEEDELTAYGSREQLPFDVLLRTGLETAELRRVLETDTEFLHYIGHIDQEGFQCVDGRLDAGTLDTVGVDAFLLNACQSYGQGMALVDAGAIAGIVTLDQVVNSGAVRMGRALARLLNRGFPLRAALEVARDESLVGSQYIVVGDGGLAIAQAESGTPFVCDIDRSEDRAEFDLSIRTYPTASHGLGTIFTPYFEGNDEYYLTSGELESFEVSREQLRHFLSLEEIPVVVNGSLHWSTDLSIEDI